MATENFNAPGISIRELRAGTPMIRGTPTSTGAFVGKAKRGRTDKALYVQSFNEFQRIYGGYLTDSYLAYEVDQFFSNGGAGCWISRVLATGVNTKAAFTLLAPNTLTSGKLTSNPASFPVALANADAFTGKVDGGAPATLTISATAGSVTGAAATYAGVVNGHHLDVTIAGHLGTQVIVFDGTENTEQKWRDAINAQLVGARAIDSGGQTEIQTDQLGTGATGSIVNTSSADVLTSLGLTAGAFTPGTGNVSDVSNITAAQFKALMDATFTGSTTTVNGDGSVTWASNTTGAASKVQFTAGAGVAKIAGFDNVEHDGSGTGNQSSLVVTALGEGLYGNNLKVVAAKEDTRIGTGIPSQITGGSHQTFDVGSTIVGKITVGDQIKIYDPSTGAIARGFVSAIRDTVVSLAAAVTTTGNLTVANTQVFNETFSLTLYEDGVIIQGPIKGLRISSLSVKDYFVTRINTDAQESQFTVTDSSPNVALGDPRPVNTVTTGDYLTGGAESNAFGDTDYVGSAIAKTGVYAFDKKKDIRLLSSCGITGTTAGYVSKMFMQYAENRGDCVCIMAPPVATAPADQVTYRNDNIGSSSYGIMLGQWIQILDPLTKQRMLIPPTGAWMGMAARTDRDAGVAQAPAGQEVGKLIGALAIERKELDDTERGTLYQANINPVEWVEAVGVCAMGSRTLEPGEFEQINIRRTFIYFETSLKEGTKWVVFAGNTKAVRARVRRSVSNFLKSEWRRGNLEGDTMQEAFYVICDERNNTEYTKNEGKMFIRVGVKIPKTTEFVIIEIEQSQAGLLEAA